MFQQSTSLQLSPLAKAILYTNHSRKWLLGLVVIRIKIFLLYLIISKILYYQQFGIHSLVWGSCKLWWRVSWLYSVQQPYEPGKVTLTSLCFISFRCIKRWTSPLPWVSCSVIICELCSFHCLTFVTLQCFTSMPVDHMYTVPVEARREC